MLASRRCGVNNPFGLTLHVAGGHREEPLPHAWRCAGIGCA